MNKRIILLSGLIMLVWSSLLSCRQSTTATQASGTQDSISPIPPLTAENYKWLREYGEAGYLGEGLFWVKNQDYQLGVLDAKGNVVVPFDEYETFLPFCNGKAIAYYHYNGQEEIRLFDINGKELIPHGFSFDFNGYPSLSDGIKVWTKDMKCGMLNETGIAIPCIYSNIKICE